MRIVFLDRASIPPHITLRRPRFPHDWVEHDRTAPEDTAARAAGADILIVNKVRVGADAMDAAPGLRLIAVAATGTDCVDLAAAAARGVAVTNIRDYARATVPEHTFALILSLRRSLAAYRESVLAGRWQESGQFCFFDHPIDDLAGSTLGLVGQGALGSSVRRIAEAFGMRVLVAGRKGDDTPPPGRTPFAQVLAESDVVTLHCPLTPQTRGLVGRAEFALMARRPLLINTARGGLVDEDALVEALDSGRIAGAGFDVATQEPPPPGHPLMRLAGRPNVLVTPHVAWASRQAIQGLADQLIDTIEAFAAGTPRNLVGG
jgi:glycerate dehydrogenase